MMSDDRATPHEIQAVVSAYGSAFLYEGRLLDPTRVSVHQADTPNRWAAFTDDELAGLDACFDACFEHSTSTLTAVRRIVFEVEAELERRKD